MELPPPEGIRANELTTYFSEILTKIQRNREHPLNPLFKQLQNQLCDLADTIDAQLSNRESSKLPPQDLAQVAILNQWLALTFLESVSSPQKNNSPTNQLFPFLLALANLETFQESSAAVYLRKLISGAYAHTRLLHTFQQLQKQYPNRFTIYTPKPPNEELDISKLSDEEASNLKLVQWEKAGVDFALYDKQKQIIYLIDAKGNQKSLQPTTNARKLHKPAEQVAESINLQVIKIQHLEITIPVPQLRNPNTILEPLPSEQQQDIISQMIK